MNAENQKKLMERLNSMSCPYCHRNYNATLPLKETPTPVVLYGTESCQECKNFIASVVRHEWTRAENCEDHGICYEPDI